MLLVRYGSLPNLAPGDAPQLSAADRYESQSARQVQPSLAWRRDMRRRK